MGSGLKPVVKPVCPVCGIAMRYYARDPNMHHSFWALTEASYQHLKDANCKPPEPEVKRDLSEVRKAPVVIRSYRRRSIHRLPSSKRRALV
ncbi:hypothetical protein SEA_MEDIUMFRY_67 [Arthrobacter phage MediumFry]|nr:hypothetical protein SEA_MEDIUMFRY_67 [Arthrobacter phage MediumFry]